MTCDFTISMLDHEGGGMGLFKVLFHTPIPATVLRQIHALLMVYARSESMARFYKRLQTLLEGYALVLLDANLVAEGLDEVDEIIAAHPTEVEFIYAIRLNNDWNYLNPDDDIFGEKLEQLIHFSLQDAVEEEERAPFKRFKLTA